MKGLGIAIISTSKGVMTDREARKQQSAARFSLTFGKRRCDKCLELEENL